MQITSAGFSRPYATLDVVKLCRCAVCETPHPRARGLDADVCECGEPSRTGERRHVRARFTGFWGEIAEVMFSIAEFLFNLGKSLK